MNTLMDLSPMWVVCVVLGLGLVSAWLARIGEGSPQQTLSHVVFLGCLPMVAGMTIVSFGLGPGYWLASAATFAVMVVAATAETRRSRGAEVF